MDDYEHMESQYVEAKLDFACKEKPCVLKSEPRRQSGAGLESILSEAGLSIERIVLVGLGDRSTLAGGVALSGAAAGKVAVSEDAASGAVLLKVARGVLRFDQKWELKLD